MDYSKFVNGPWIESRYSVYALQLKGGSPLGMRTQNSSAASYSHPLDNLTLWRARFVKRLFRLARQISFYLLSVSVFAF
jgi:hypothetical protein